MKVKKYQPTLSLKPTQFALGLLEVEFKVVEMKGMKPGKLDKLVRETPVPVVVSPWKELCITDRHHFLFACWHAGVRRVRVEVVKDYSRSKLTYHGFWKKLAREKRAYLYDQFGEGPRSPLYLPIDIRGMADDPYRSLAWMVRKEGGFENSDLTFAEFHWADFFRAKRLLDSHGRKGFHDAIKKGLRLAHSSKARSLPGYLKRAADRITKAKEAEVLEKSKYVPVAQKKGHLAARPAMG